MKQYDTYKDSGIAWIGEIPSEWEVCKTSRLYEIQLGKMLQPSQQNEEDILCNYLCAANVSKNTLKLESIKQMWISPSERQQYAVKKGDLLVVEGGDIASCAIIEDNIDDCYIQNALHRVRPKKGNGVRFLKYCLNAVKDSGHIDFICNRATIAHFTKEKFANLTIPLPSINEQHSIATFLDTKCVEIDALISLQEEMISELQAYKQSVITEAVTKGLNPNAKMKDSGVEWIGEIPESWNVCKAKFLVNISHGMDPVTDGDIPVYGSGADSFKTCGEYKEGDAVLIGRKGATLHIPHYIKGRYWNVDTAFDVKAKDNFNLRYYYYNAICFDYKKYMSQTTLPGMTQSNYNNMKLPCPPLPEQHSITTYLDEKTSQIDSLISLKQQKIEELRDYKKSIIYEYVTGKKRV